MWDTVYETLNGGGMDTDSLSLKIMKSFMRPSICCTQLCTLSQIFLYVEWCLTLLTTARWLSMLHCFLSKKVIGSSPSEQGEAFLHVVKMFSQCLCGSSLVVLCWCGFPQGGSVILNLWMRLQYSAVLLNSVSIFFNNFGLGGQHHLLTAIGLC